MFLAARGIKTDDFIKDLQEQADELTRQSLALDAVAHSRTSKPPTMMSVLSLRRLASRMSKKTIEEWRSAGRLPAIRGVYPSLKALDWLRDVAPGYRKG